MSRPKERRRGLTKGRVTSNEDRTVPQPTSKERDTRAGVGVVQMDSCQAQEM